MAGIGMKLMSFLIVMHSIFFFAGESEIIQHQAGQTNEHQEFVQRFDENATKTLDTGNTDASIFDQIRLSAQSLPFIGFVVEIFSAPYVFIEGTSIPSLYVTIFQALLGFFETAAIASYIRGYDF